MLISPEFSSCMNFVSNNLAQIYVIMVSIKGGFFFKFFFERGMRMDKTSPSAGSTKICKVFTCKMVLSLAVLK